MTFNNITQTGVEISAYYFKEVITICAVVFTRTLFLRVLSGLRKSNENLLIHEQKKNKCTYSIRIVSIQLL